MRGERMSKRAPATPPDLPGFTPIDVVGSGGYADVFLYEQTMPSRHVAVKVLVAGAVPSGAEGGLFTAEANLMARVSAHPYIVQVFQADISADGRPYLVMEYYPGPNYYDRAKREHMSVSEVLRTGVQLASAIETAHRAGIFHRDIKPANILTSEFHRPGLTDFGIASAQGPGGDTAEGVSIPWAPPESLGDATADSRGDVYSLAATLYTLLTGRSPFEIPGGDNRQLALIARIERSPVPSVGRADVPATLERVLAAAMAKDPAHRPGSAAELGRQLQGIESELKLSVTPLELADESRSVRARVDLVDDDSTRVKGVAELHAQPDALISGVGGAPSKPPPLVQRRREGLLAEPEVSETVHRVAADSVAPIPEYVGHSVNKAYIYAGAALAVIALVVVAAVMLKASEDVSTARVIDESEVNTGFDSPIAVGPPSISELDGVDNGDGTFTFTWDAPAEGLEYAITQDGGVSGTVRIDETSFTGSVSCIEVESIGASGLVSSAFRGCA